MTFASVCSGVGGCDLGFERAGFKTLWLCEIDPACRNVLRRHFPSVPIHHDLSQLDGTSLPRPDVLIGGTPCQGFSVAGQRGSLSDDRSNLCLQFCRLADELNPSILVWENVPGVLNTADNAFGCFLAALVGADAPLVPPKSIDRWGVNSKGKESFSWTNAGLVVGPKRTAAWRVLDSQYFRVPQRRERVFVVADSLGGCAGEILFERTRGGRNSAPSRETRERIAYDTSPSLTGNGRGTERTGESRGQDCVIPVIREPIPILEVGARTGKSAEDPRAGIGIGSDGDPMFTLQAGKQNGVCCFQSKDCGESSDNIAPALRALNFDKSHMNGGGQLAVAFKPSHFTRDKDGAPNEVAPPLSADADKGDQDTVIAYRASGNCGVMEQGDKPAALNTATDPNQNIVTFQARIARNGHGQPSAVVPALNGSDAGATSDMRPCILNGMQVRRLLPVETERLQSHPDDWTAWGLDEQGNRVNQSDSARYRQMGNGVTVNVLEFIARRIKQVCLDHRIEAADIFQCERKT